MVNSADNAAILVTSQPIKQGWGAVWFSSWVHSGTEASSPRERLMFYERGKRREHMSGPHFEKFSGSEGNARRKVEGKPLDFHITSTFILHCIHMNLEECTCFPSVGFRTLLA